MYYVPVLSYSYNPDSGKYTPVNAKGWGEFSYSDKLMNVYDRYPEDYRYNAYLYKYGNDSPAVADGQKMIYFSRETVTTPEGGGDPLITQMPVRGNNVTYNDADDTYTFEFGGKNFTVKSKMIYKDKVWYVEEAPDATCPRDSDGHYRVSVRDYVLDNSKFYPAFMMRKFAEQPGHVQLSSPVMIRWAEVILNRAEAKAKTDDEAGALEDINVLRRRAGLPDEAMYTMGNYTEYGYTSVLDAVLEERNLELCFEGHRAIDLYRNNMPIDRRYPGLQDYKILDLDYLDQNFPLYLPFNEVEVSGIKQSK